MLGEDRNQGAADGAADPAAAEARARSRFGERRRIAIGIVLVLFLLFLGLWFARKPVAEGFIDRELAAHHVPARYRIADLGLGRQRLRDVVIGDPRAPDLVADWLETETAVGFSGPFLKGVRAGHVRLRGRIVDGRVSLGAIDRLLPPPSGKPFALPVLEADIADLRIRLDTPAGPVGLKLSGRGKLADGFAGTVAGAAPSLANAGCTARGVAAVLRLRIAQGRPHLAGPVRAADLSCAGGQAKTIALALDTEFGAALDRWVGSARVSAASGQAGGIGARALGGLIRFAGGAAATGGTIDLAAQDVRSLRRPGVAARRVGIAGDYRLGQAMAFDGTVNADHAALPPALLRPVTALAESAAGTPVAPLATQLARAGQAAARDLSGEMTVALRYAGGQGAARLSRLAARSGSGARIALAGGNGVAFGWPTGGMRVDTRLTLAGGGLPEAAVALAQDAAGAPMRGTATIRPYAAGDARLALSPVVFSTAAGGATRIATRATLSGPLGDGRVEGLSLPLSVHLGRGAVVVNPACAPLTVDRLMSAGLRLEAAKVVLCPLDGALVRANGERVDGGVRVGATRLAGRLGSSPLTLALAGGTFDLARRAFTARAVAARLGGAERQTSINVATLSGRVGGDALTGRFAGGAGQIGNVPLLLSAADGNWRLAGGDLGLTGALTVADAQTASPRFQPLAARDVVLTLANGVIDARGRLAEPASGTKVADVVIRHQLSDGAGAADLRVPGIAFTDGFQPDRLTRLTYGVIADVRGTVSGEGHIGWTDRGVTSTGVFRTAGTDLAAAFGPVTGIATEIRFTDLLALASAPGQVASVRTINPGVPVNDGRITFQTLPESRIQVERGDWPFAGGTLRLDPTLLDFSQAAERRMTFHVAGVRADQFLQQFDFDNLDATGIFDGVLPMIFDQSGGRIENGDLTVREGGGTIAYVGDLTQKDLGLWGNIAFQALKSLRYRSLTIGMNGPLAGEMITSVRFAGVSQGAGAKSNFLIRRLQRLPFVFNIRIKAPFRGLIDSAQSFYDPKRLIQRNLPALIQQQGAHPAAPVQPPASETLP